MTATRAGALVVLLALAASPLVGCASSRPAHVRVLPPRPASVGVSAPSDSMIARTALGYLGTPYVLGGTTPSGFDCSGFVWYVYRLQGLTVPRNVANQAGAGVHVDREDVRAGDLVFFRTTGSGPTHVGIATGPDAFVHAPNSRGVVRVEPLTTPYWSQRYAGARRVVPAEPDR